MTMVLFQLVSVIITYSFLLLKLKDNPAVSPIRRNLLANSTSWSFRADFIVIVTSDTIRSMKYLLYTYIMKKHLLLSSSTILQSHFRSNCWSAVRQRPTWSKGQIVEIRSKRACVMAIPRLPRCIKSDDHGTLSDVSVGSERQGDRALNHRTKLQLLSYRPVIVLRPGSCRRDFDEYSSCHVLSLSDSSNKVGFRGSVWTQDSQLK